MFGKSFVASTLQLVVCLATALPAAAARPDPIGPADFAAREAAWQRHRELARSSPLAGLVWRNIGPVVQGGRVVDVESVPGEPYTFYVAYASGGLWRTTNNGVTFDPVFDDAPTLILGDVAVDPRNPDTIWVGTGENNSSRSSYGGMGVYRTDDAGATWRHVGLGDTDRIGRILVDPRESRRVYVASLGKLYTAGGDRGVYRSEDGGSTWQLVLDTSGANEWTGVIDLTFEPGNPDVLYAAAWERSRRPWDFVESGPGSGVYKSTDRGKSWTRLGGGFPEGKDVGRIGLAVSPSNPRIVYASVDNQELLPEELWDLGDGAVNAKRLRAMTKQEFLEQDPEAIEDFIRGNDLDASLDAKKLIRMIRDDELSLAELLAELDDANANLFQTDIRGLEVYRSDNGGRTWRRTHDQPIREVTYTYGYYFGQIRVAPDDPDRIYCLGVPVVTSADGGRTFEGLNGRGVHVDHHEFWIDPNYPQRTIVGNDGGLDVSYDGGASWLKLDRQPVGQFYAIAVDMQDPYNVYGGLQDNGTLKGSSRSRPGIDDWRRIGGGDGMYVQVDPRDGTTYVGFQFGFYQRIDPDGKRTTVRPRDLLREPALRYNWATPILLSSHNHDVLYFGTNRLYRSLDKGDSWAPISPELTRSSDRGDVPFATLTSVAESPLQFGLLWVGSDDGQLQVSDDGGVEWRDVADGLPRDRWVSRVEASHHERDRAYVSLNGYRDDDITPYLHVTEDLGRSWRSIAAGLPAEAVNVIREDPVNPDVLYVGTDGGAYTSLDRGKSWLGLPSGMPRVPVHDLVVHPRERELVAGTHGRSVYVLDALPIQELTSETRERPVVLFPVEPVKFERGWRNRRSPWFHRPEDDPDRQVPFWSAEAGRAVFRVLDDDDRELRRIELQVERGVHTVTWDLLLDEELALAAEREARAEAAADEEDEKAGEDGASSKDKKGKRPNRGADEPSSSADQDTSREGIRAKTPWAEAVRLDWPLYITPGKYKLRVEVGDASDETELEIESPRPREPRQKQKPSIRGREKDE